MGDRQARAGWRAGFLRALARGGSVTGAARVAGVDKTTAYVHRRRDAGFAADWDAAKFRAQQGLAAGAVPVLAADEVVRASKAGRPCVVRAGPGRWSAGAERTFLEELATDANVTRAAAAAGVSTVAVYARREKWPRFAERWDSALAQGYAQLEALLIHCATSTLSGGSTGGEPVVGRVIAELAGVRPTFSEAMALFRLHRHSVTGEGKRSRHDWARTEPSIEEVQAEVLRRVKALGG